MSGKTCSACGAEFTCNSEQDTQACWCAAYPAIMPISPELGCRCQSCLGRIIAERIHETIQTTSHEQILEMAKRFNNEASLIENIDYTIEDGNYVFSAWYHLKRGTCCGNGCRNCPYPEQPALIPPFS